MRRYVASTRRIVKVCLMLLLDAFVYVFYVNNFDNLLRICCFTLA